MTKHSKHAPEDKPPAPKDGAEAPAAPAATPEPAEAPEVKALKDRLLRLQADFDNFRKRTQREKAEYSQSALEGILAELLPVLDHYEMGLKSAAVHQTDSAVIDGFRLVYDQLMGVLARFGLTPIDAEGQDFNPHLHEAITHMPSEDVPPDTIMAQTRRGYLLGERLLRASQVVVSSGPAAGETGPAPAEPGKAE